ncbi:TIGR03086 family metal-binding protein [Amycolatopsis sp. CA-230715]|uniref:TIGR03086 family metal-binding protein n=1 Tax=Amycolatopsis sp. CA-230715 TaxID=2745196 RepID=UPI001C012E7E|nr:TIGR03086 family metal-binding protein [Amycolatopsis sp. CA-230715]QWF84888.1 hypothetical protein HUW46_08340 [Amycolatopsis sp. CA-230715]
MFEHDDDEALFGHLRTANAGLLDRLRRVRHEHWAQPTPCAEWTVRQLVSHLVQANLIYALLLRGGRKEQFITIREQDTLGDDPLAAFERAAAECSAEFRAEGALDRAVDYPFGPVVGRQLLGLLIADVVVHTWDLARAIEGDERLDPELVSWTHANIEAIFDGVSDGPTATDNSGNYFAYPPSAPPRSADPQNLLLHLMGRTS